jgi:hypothetical protein
VFAFAALAASARQEIGHQPDQRRVGAPRLK